ncbi:MAG: aminotransferase class IV family protein [Bacteroidetes bacterium]|nr:aminotransferase class IV family protein [Bacteroidota bacterium]MBL6943085.1 aminotransferase class IV family protein [Bacteroidales bacterium]
MKQESSLLTHFIHNSNIVGVCDFVSEKINSGIVIYEVLRVINGVPLFLTEHIERFYNSVGLLGYSTAISNSSLHLRIKTLIETNKLEYGNIRFQISYTDSGETQFYAWVTPYFYPTHEMYQNGASLTTFRALRVNPNIKVFNPGLREKVTNLISQSVNYEALLINNNDLITEGSRSNVFFVTENRIVTPSLCAVLPGITRLKAIEITKKVKIECKEGNISQSSLPLFDAAFITSTSAMILPLSSINDVPFNPRHPIIKIIIDAYNVMVKKNIETFSWSLISDNSNF